MEYIKVIYMEYITEEQFDEVGMNIMNLLDSHSKVVERLLNQNEQLFNIMFRLSDISYSDF